MSVQIIDCDQNSPEWFEARKGLPTASQFKAILAPAKNGTDRKTRNTYMRKLAGEIVTGRPMDSFANEDTMRGHAQEDDAANQYAFLTGHTLTKVGFGHNGLAGASPDRLVGNDGIVEFKAKRADLMVELLLDWDGQIANEHKAQCQGQLWIFEREWVEWPPFCPNMPMPIARAYRDERYIAELAREVRIFKEELDEMVDRVRRFGLPGAQVAA